MPWLRHTDMLIAGIQLSKQWIPAKKHTGMTQYINT